MDTNVWVKTNLLRTALGAALINSLWRLEGLLGLPEVVEEEIVKNTVKLRGKSATRIREDLRRIEGLIGWVEEYVPPTEAQFEASTKERLQEFEVLLKRVPYNFQQAKSAHRRVMDESPPNSPKSQQYKDSVIWESVRELSQTHTVHFITEDKAFFENGEPDRGLASNLREECEREGSDIYVYQSLESYLVSLKEAVPPLDRRSIAEAVDTAIIDDLAQIASDQEFELGKLLEWRISPFLTENSEELAVSFELVYRALVFSPSEPGAEIEEAKLVTKGDCLYNLRQNIASDVRKESVKFFGAQGDLIAGKSMSYIYGGFVSAARGRPGKPYTLRIPID